MMTPGELDEFLTTQRTCRVATVSKDGAPHVSALWFVWTAPRCGCIRRTRSAGRS